MGKPMYPTPSQLTELRAASELSPVSVSVKAIEGGVQLTLAQTQLLPFAVVNIVLYDH